MRFDMRGPGATGEERAALYRARPGTRSGQILLTELDLAARMAAQSCKIMLWQQALAAGKGLAKRLAKTGIRELGQLEHDFQSYWPLRNQGTTAKCSAFLRWRLEDYHRGVLHYPPEVARVAQTKTYAAQ